MAMKKSVWDMILKVVIAVASAVAGVLGANAMSLLRNLNSLKGTYQISCCVPFLYLSKLFSKIKNI